MTTGEMILTQSKTIMAFGTFRIYARGALLMGLLVSVGAEFLAWWQKGKCDVLIPVFRVLVAGVLLEFIVPIGSWAGDISSDLGTVLSDTANADLLTSALEFAFSKTSAVSVTTLALRTIVALFSLLIIFGMFLAKIFVMKVLFPTFFTLAVFSGLLSLPLYAFPEQKSVSGWLSNLLEIAMWPAIYGLLCSVCVSNMKGTLENLQQVDLMLMFGDMAAAMGPVPGVVGKVDMTKLQEALDKGLFVYLEFVSLCLGFIFFCLYTPLLARTVVRSESMGQFGGMMAAQAFSFGTTALGHAARNTALSGAMSKFAPYSSALRAGLDWHDNRGSGGGNSKRDAMKDLNKRQHQPPPGSEGGSK